MPPLLSLENDLTACQKQFREFCFIVKLPFLLMVPYIFISLQKRNESKLLVMVTFTMSHKRQFDLDCPCPVPNITLQRHPVDSGHCSISEDVMNVMSRTWQR